MRLYRAVSKAELDDLNANGLRFRTVPGAMEAKWFSETLEGARRWAVQWEQWDGAPYHVVEVEVPDAIANTFFRVLKLDQVADARCAAEVDFPNITFVRVVT